MADPNGTVATTASTTHHSPKVETASYLSNFPPQRPPIIANPTPTGLLGFAISTFVLGLYHCGAGLPNSDPRGPIGPDNAAFGLAVFMGGMNQIIAGIMQFRLGNTFGSTVHCSYGSFWLGYAMLLIPSLNIRAAYGGDERAYTFAIGIYLTLWCFLTIIFLFASLRTNLAVIGVFVTLVLTYFFLAIANFIQTSSPHHSVRVHRLGGAMAVICAFIAFYAGASGLMIPETTWVRLPVGEIQKPESAVV
ncbi:hypothetical protein FQN57_001220 [Myotisia sp. PD_48]|nr:hypothetical protein FQN57_001220 [Myotisia sp. PD_48]